MKPLPLKNIDRFHRFIKERHAIYQRRSAGAPKPWTRDEILQSFRFCNVFRELDTVTEWIRVNWRDPNTSDPDLFFAMSVARVFNRTCTLDVIGYPVPWKPERAFSRISAFRAAGHAVFTGAYMVSTNGTKKDKVEYVIENVLNPLWKQRHQVRPFAGDTLVGFSQRLIEQNGFKGFMAGQVTCDVKYAEGSHLRHAEDWWSFAVSGPGSRRGLNRVVGRGLREPWREHVWHEVLMRLHERTPEVLGEPLHAQDLQNCLCEFDKYERVRLGEGRPRSRYPGV
jgi:hypothetical protein